MSSNSLPDSPRTYRGYGIVSVLAGILGWIASFILFTEYAESLKDKDHIVNCDLSATISCSQNFGSSFGSLFGFSNTVIGLSLFLIPIVIGVLLIAKVDLPNWVRIGNVVGITAALGLTIYLQWASFTQLATLCIYCFLIWTAVISLFWGSFSTISSHNGTTGRVLQFLSANWWMLAIIHLVALLVVGELHISAVSELLAVMSE